MKSISQLFKFLFDKKMKVSFIILLTVSCILALLEAFTVGVMFPFVNFVQDPSGYSSTGILKAIRDFMGNISINRLILILCVFLLCVYLIKSIISILQIKMLNNLTQKFFYTLSNRLLKSYLLKPYTFFLNSNCTVLSKNITYETMNLAMQMVDPIMYIISESLVLIFIVSALMIVNIKIAVITLASFGVIFGLIFLLTSNLNKRLGLQREQSYSQMAKLSYESLLGIKEIKISGQYDYFVNSFSKHSKANAKVAATHGVVVSLPRIILETLLMMAVVSLLVYYKVGVSNSETIIATLVMYLAAAYRLLPSLNRIVSALMRLKFSQAGLELIISNIEEQSSPDLETDKEAAPISFQNNVVMDKVSFRYEKSGNYVLKDYSMEIKKGDIIGIVGPSGAGKSTILNILIGLLQPEEGTIYVDNVEITEGNKKNWQANISYVPQHVFIADDTMAKNIAFGISNDKINYPKINRIIEDVQLKELVVSTPEGLSVVLGDRGTRLSGGQIQRIGIARALYRDKPIIIFDEATSAIDIDTEKSIIERIREYESKPTIIIVTHRDSTLKYCTKLFKIEENNSKN